MKVTANDKVDVGMQAAKRCDQVFNEISTTINDVNNKVSLIADSSQEQAIGIKQVSNSMDALRSIASQTSEISKASLNNSGGLASYANALEDLSVELTSLVEGARSVHVVQDKADQGHDKPLRGAA